jgi:hypothetical protein
MKGIILIVMFFLCLTVKAQDTIFWNKNTKLAISDFKGKIPIETTYGGIASMNAKIKFYNDSTLCIKSTFLSNRSWLKERNAYALNHEQKHFDLYEVSMRILRKQLCEYTFSLNNAQNELDSLSNLVFNKNDELQDQYDKETDHSIITKKQEEWDKYIQIQLELLEEYSSPYVVLHFKEESIEVE